MTNSIDSRPARALELLNQGQGAAALALFKAYLIDFPQDAAAWNNFGLAWAQQKEWAQATQAYQRALRLKPGLAEVHNNMGTAFRQLKDYAQAEKAHRRALALKPALMEAHNNLGLLWMENQRPEDAVQPFIEALRLQPNHLAVRENLAKALYLAGDRAASCAAWESLLAISKPELAWNLALSELACGNWARAWRLYESRFHRPGGRVKHRHPDLPAWPADQRQAHLLLWGEQGAGDQIMASRWIESLSTAVDALTVEVDHRLLHLFQASFPRHKIIAARQKARPDELAGVTHQCPMFDLPTRLKLFADADYAKKPWLRASSDAVARWQKRLGAARAPRVALVWIGNPEHVNDQQRSISLAQLRPLVGALPGLEFHALQVGEGAGQLFASDLPVQCWSGELDSFDDTAALLGMMDAVLTIDTSVAHLAGALGRPTLLLLPQVGEWRWDAPGLNGNDCLWYDSLSYVRQSRHGDWPSAIDKARGMLAERFPAAGDRQPARRWKDTVDALLAAKTPAPRTLGQFAAAPAIARRWVQTLLAAGERRQALSALSGLLGNLPKELKLRLLASDLARGLAKAAPAERYAREALALAPKSAEAWLHLGNALREGKQLSAAAEALEKAVAIDPGHLPARNNLGIVRREMGDNRTAIDHYRAAIAAKPDYLAAWTNLGNALRDEGEFAEAAACFSQVIEQQPDNANAYFGLGNVYKEEVRVGEAIDIYRRGLVVSPEHADLRVNLSLQLLLDGQLAEGWDLYETRFFREKRPVPKRKFKQPWWRGEDIAGKTLLLWGEQGAGDRLMFARLIPRILERAGRVIIETDPRMLSLMQRSFPQVSWIAEQTPALPATTQADWQAPIGHLAKVFVRSCADFDAGGPYLQPDSALIASWQERLKALPGKRIGLVWSGNPGHQNDAQRSMALEQLSPLRQIAGLSLVSLQVGEQAGKFGGDGPWSEHIYDAAPWLKSYDDTAALLSCLDGLVTVDTSVAHLAGAVGCPVSVLLPFCPDWRWMTGYPQSTPWYASMRLYRQRHWRNWQEPVAQLSSELAGSLGLIFTQDRLSDEVAACV